MITQNLFDTVLADITSGELDAQLDILSDAIKERRRIKTLTFGYQLKPGDQVAFNENTHPRYMIGLKAKILSINQVTAYVEMLPGQNAGKFDRSSRIRVPFNLLIKV